MEAIRARLDKVRSLIDEAARKSGRSSAEVTVVAVTKGLSLEVMGQAVAAGCLILGENRIQEALTKIPNHSWSGEVQWHMVGHLQTNKVKTALSLFSLIQSVDSVRLAGEISKESVLKGLTTSMLLEVNISAEEQKYGFSPEEIYTAIESISEFSNIKIMGLMGIAPNVADEDAKRQAFKKLRNIFSVCKTLKKENIEMRYLSMGMSDDFQIAVEEGSNMVRLGRALFK